MNTYVTGLKLGGTGKNLNKLKLVQIDKWPARPFSSAECWLNQRTDFMLAGLMWIVILGILIYARSLSWEINVSRSQLTCPAGLRC